MHYTEIIAFLSLFVLMFLVIIGFFAFVKCIVVIYQRCTSRLWFLKRKRQGISNLILQPIEQTIYQVNLDDSSLVAATQSIPLDRREYITKKVEQKVLEEALIQRKNVLKTLNNNNNNNNNAGNGTGIRDGTNSSSSSHSNIKTLIDYDIRYLTNVAEMQRLVQNCWTTNFGHRESLSEEERWIQKLVLKVNLKIDNAVAGYVLDQHIASALNQVGQPFECPFSFLTGESTPSSLLSPSPTFRRPQQHCGNINRYRLDPSSSSSSSAQQQQYTSSSYCSTPPPDYSSRRPSSSSAAATGVLMDLTPPKFETLRIDHPDWPPSYDICILGKDTTIVLEKDPSSSSPADLLEEVEIKKV